MSLLYTAALCAAAAQPREGVLKTTIELGKSGNAIAMMWDREINSFGEVIQRANSKAPAREGIQVLGTEVFRHGRWRVIKIGDECPV